jgi:hypothetical protein
MRSGDVGLAIDRGAMGRGKGFTASRDGSLNLVRPPGSRTTTDTTKRNGGFGGIQKKSGEKKGSLGKREGIESRKRGKRGDKMILELVPTGFGKIKRSGTFIEFGRRNRRQGDADGKMVRS